MGNTTHTLSTRDAAWLADTFRRNSERFAGWRMEADPPGDSHPSDPQTPEPPAPDAPAPDDGKGGKDAILADLARERDKRQELEGKVTELTTAQQAQMDAIAKALGLKADDSPPDPAKLAEQIATEQAKVTEAESRADRAERELAIFKAAANHEGDPVALTDSTTFMSSIKDVDHTDAAALGEAIKKAVAENPRLKAAAAAPPFPGGPRKTSTPSDPGPGLPRLRDAYAQSSK